jgi:DNA-binding response OmpR family regulator
MEPEPNHVVILVIEDDPNVRTLLRDIFVEEDYDVLLAASGEKALVTLTTVQPDLITLDLDLPGINGAVVLRQLREQQETERLPVVLVSAKERISSEVKAQAQAIVRKPFDVDDLLAVVRRLLPPLAKVALR